MSLWKLEWYRLSRTNRGVSLLGVFTFFGILGPLTARYISEIIGAVGGGVVVSLPDPTPADGIIQYVSNVQQIGLLVLILIAASALSIQDKVEMAVFLRTRTQRAGQLLAPRVATVACAGVGAFGVGLLFAWYETVVLIGELEPLAMLGVFGLAALYILFAVAVVAFAGSRFSTTLPTTVASILALLFIPLIGLAPEIGDWLPSHLLSGTQLLVAGSGVEFSRAVVVTGLLAVGLLWGAARKLERVEF